MLTRVLHLSDLHFGRHETPEAERALAPIVERAAPELVIASGDLTHRGRREQHERAAAFLRSLGPPVLAIPGNHDIPYTFPARFRTAFVEFERLWGTTQPVFRSDTLLVVGLNSVRPWRHQSGGVSEGQLSRTSDLLETAAPGALRVVTLHHHLLGAPWRSSKRPVAQRNQVLVRLVEAGAELILAGHIHQAAVSERREFEIATGNERGVTVSIAPGLGQPRPDRHGEARGLHVYTATDDAIRIETYVWRDGGWGLTAERRFPRGRDPLAFQPER